MGRSSGALATTRSGKIEGSEEDGVFVFRGIPYAEAPVGPRRWLPPEPVAPWSGVRPAKAFGAVPCQGAAYVVARETSQEEPAHTGGRPVRGQGVEFGLPVPGPRSEDCLFLNVWTPGLDDAKRPVMFWVHGGGWQVGAGSQPNYDGRTLAARGDVVVVTINYRLGSFGFLRLDELTGGAIPSTGNEGSLDHIAALAWVRENIAAFGGDPDNVTIWGQSAGSVLVAALLVSPLAEGLFHRAILHSSAAHTSHDVESATRVARIWLESLGVQPTDIDAIRALTPDRMVAASSTIFDALLADDPSQGIMHNHPVVDGTFLTARPIDALRAGAASDIPVLTGTNLDEHRRSMALAAAGGTLYIAAGKPVPPSLTREQAADLLGHGPSRHWEGLVDTYTASREAHGEPAGPIDVLLAIETARCVRIPTIRLLEAKQAHRQPAYTYLVTWRSPATGGIMRACHEVELDLLFGTYDDTFSGTGPDADALASALQDAWTAFARTGGPSCDSLGSWPSYGEARETMVLGQRCQLVSDPYGDERRAWDEIPDDDPAVRIGLM